jgi:hypothetical protein
MRKARAKVNNHNDEPRTEREQGRFRLQANRTQNCGATKKEKEEGYLPLKRNTIKWSNEMCSEEARKA